VNKKILYIILVALAILLLVILLWWWFLGRENTTVQKTGTFGTAQNSSQSGTGAGGSDQTNVGTVLPGQNPPTETQTNIQLGNVGTANTSGATPAPIGVILPTTDITQVPVQGQIGVPGVIWLSGTPGGTQGSGGGTGGSSGGTGNTGGGTTQTSGPGTVFNPIGINQIVQSNPTGNGGALPNIGVNAYGQQTGSGSNALGSIATAAGVGVVTCAIVPALQSAAQALGFTEGAAKQVTAQKAADALVAEEVVRAVSTIDLAQNIRIQIGTSLLSAEIARSTGSQTSQQFVDQFMGCMTRNIAKIMLQQITASVVNWINSGFNGSPAFVQNPSQFLQQTADQVAGNYIQSSALSFLCSPFQLQIRIAIAQSYANRNANSCTLTQVTNNINNFMRGNFLSGNWKGMLAFTSVPTNNPYGAFLYGSIGLQAAIDRKQGQVQTDLLQGSGFLSFQQKQKCNTVSEDKLSGVNVGPNKSFTEKPGPVQPGQAAQYEVCDWVTTTPGTVIASSLESTLKGSIDQITLAKSFDEIISALINQLMTRTLQNGLSTLSGANGYASNFYSTDQLQSQTQGQGLVAQMQADTNLAVQYANVQQASIKDIENAQSQLNDLFNCWGGIASSSPIAAQAATNAGQASSTLHALDATIGGYNNRITLANESIVILEQLESRALSSGSTFDINNIRDDYNAAKGSGKLVTQNDVVLSQQNRTTLQSQMSVLSQQTSVSLQQCYAAH
jgi:hypothetical protein